MSQPTDFTAKEHLQILLAEYSGLRSDQINRTGSAYQLVGFAIAGAGIVASLNRGWLCRCWSASAWRLRSSFATCRP
jgi:hypothetical protein